MVASKIVKILVSAMKSPGHSPDKIQREQEGHNEIIIVYKKAKESSSDLFHLTYRF